MTPLALGGSWKTRRSADQREFQRRSGSPAGACGPWEGLPSPGTAPTGARNWVFPQNSPLSPDVCKQHGRFLWVTFPRLSGLFGGSVSPSV